MNKLIVMNRTITETRTPDLSNIATELTRIRFEYDKIRGSEKPIVTIPSIFRRTFDENFISDYLAYILHPTKSGLGFKPLNALLSLSGMQPSLSRDDTYSIEVRREHYLSEESRIDILILIRSQKLLFALENKIFSSEGYRQTLRYTEAIQESFPGYTYLFLYLTPTGMPPQSADFKPLAYADLLIALRPIDLSQLSERDRVIFTDFLYHVENNIMKSANITLSEKSLLYLQNREMMTDLQNSFSEDSSSIFQAITELIKSRFSHIGEPWEFSLPEDRAYHQVWKKQWQKNQFWIHFEFWFSKESLFTNEEISFMVDVEGRQKDSFLIAFDRIQPRLKSKYQASNIQYRPSSRRLAIAFKTYPFQLPPAPLKRNSIESFFKNAIDEFAFLIETIDQLIKKNKFK